VRPAQRALCDRQPPTCRSGATHNAVRYTLRDALDGPVVAFDFHNCEHLVRAQHARRRSPPRRALVLFRGRTALRRNSRRSGPTSSPTWSSTYGGGKRTGSPLDKCRREGVAALQGHGLNHARRRRGHGTGKSRQVHRTRSRPCAGPLRACEAAMHGNGGGPLVPA
jgi:hypothetical protein